MPYTLNPLDKTFKKAPSFWRLLAPLRAILHDITPLEARGNRPLQMDFEDQLNALIYFHLEEHTSGRHLLQVLKEEFSHLGDLVAIDGSLIDAVLSMDWADYRQGAKKAKTHMGRGIPQKIFLTDGKGDERPFVSQILAPGKSKVRTRVEHVFGAQDAMGGHFVRTIGLLRAQVKIGMMNLVYNMIRLVQLLRRDMKMTGEVRPQ